jgi:hypothetical protein
MPDRAEAHRDCYRPRGLGGLVDGLGFERRAKYRFRRPRWDSIHKIASESLMSFPTHPVTELICQRYSCRVYQRKPIDPQLADTLRGLAQSSVGGPFGEGLRFELLAASDEDPIALRGLGTYGLIRNPAGFFIGAVAHRPRALEDYGYVLESLLLHASSQGVSSCWLGGNFTKSSFAARIGAAQHEIVPAVASVGYAAENTRSRDPLRKAVRADSRLPWETLFFRSQFGTALEKGEAGQYAEPLAMLRLAPSSHNGQPWRVVRDGNHFHFYLQRKRGYGRGSLTFRLLDLADLERVDMGIAMCHFELTARELGLEGDWKVEDPHLLLPNGRIEYTATWKDAATSGNLQ